MSISKYLSLLIIAVVAGCSNSEYTSKENDPVQHIDTISEALESDFDIPVFVYHRFSDSRYPSTSIDTSLFRRHLQIIKDSGFKAVSISELLERINAGETDSLCLITIDDGYKTVLRGVKILKEFDYSGAVFVNTSTVGSGDYMTWGDLKELHSFGIDIGNHTHSHPFLLESDENPPWKLLETELTHSQQLFDQNLGFEPKYFAYPYGEFEEGHWSVLQQRGFLLAFAQNSGVFSAKTSNPFKVPRFPMNDIFGRPDRFREKLNMRSLHVRYLSDSANQYNINPPKVRLEILTPGVEPTQLQFFVGGRKESIEVEGDRVTLMSSQPLSSRRTLYTLTARANDGSWYWFSHPWFDISIPDQ